MAIVDSQGVRIHFEIEGEGEPLVLLHGFTDSPLVWYERGYVQALKPDHMLIIPSLRGHHLSGKPHDPEAYRTEHYVADVVALLDTLAIKKTHFFGYSLGGWIGYALAHDAPDRLLSLIIGGAGPVAFPPGSSDPYMPVLKQGAPALLNWYQGLLTPAFEARLLASDMEALIASRRARFESPGYDAYLEAMTMPALVFAGDADPVHDQARESASRMPNANFLSLPGLRHVASLYESQHVLPSIQRFLKRHSQVSPE